MEANAALRTIVRRDSGETYREMLKHMAEESGIETPLADDLIRMDRARKGKKLSNEDWVSGTDPEAKIAKMKDGTTHLAYKPEHAVDLDTGAVVAAEIHPADDGDTTTLEGTLQAAEGNLAAVGMAPTEAVPAELVADKGSRRRRLEDADRRAAAHGVPSLARRYRGTGRRLRQPQPPSLGDRQGGDAKTSRDRRAVLRPQPGARRLAADLAERT
jgi:hypothetical protein